MTILEILQADKAAAETRGTLTTPELVKLSLAGPDNLAVKVWWRGYTAGLKRAIQVMEAPEVESLIAEVTRKRKAEENPNEQT